MDDSGFAVGDPNCLAGVPNHPVAWVSFQEAVAYCGWLTEKLREADWTPASLRERLLDGWTITLPSEAEWEKAARGADGRVYPWGDQFDALRANGGMTGLGATSAVGLFPSGAAPSECLDMSGNVWEWTRSVYGSYPKVPVDSARKAMDTRAETSKVLRGGSFRDSKNSLRAAYRYGYYPTLRNDCVGFRLVCSSSSR